jgi:hypothetical protein
MNENQNITYSTDGNRELICFPVEVTQKDIKSFVIDLDEFQMMETGNKMKNGIPVAFIKFMPIIKK